MKPSPPDARASADSQALVTVLGTFARLIEARDVEGAAALWDVPALILGDGHAHGPLSNARLAEFLASAVQGHGESGSTTPGSAAPPPPTSTSMEDSIARVEWLSDRVAQIETRWPQRSYAGLLEGVTGTSFIVRIDERGHPKIRAMLLRNRAPAGNR